MALNLRKNFKYIILIIFVVVGAGVAGSYFINKNERQSEVMPHKPWDETRLSPDIQPVLYNLLLHPNLRTGLFKGKVTIQVNVKSKQYHVALHIKGLTITKTEIIAINENRPKLKFRETFKYDKNEFWVIVPEEELQPGIYDIFLEFNGKLTNKIVGFYQSVYKDADGEERRIATTKFEPTFARQAFPCFDEPSFKARYNIELVKPSGNDYIALSNMNKVGEEPNKPETGLTTVKFHTSLPMSTYLACFIVCDFGHTDPVMSEQGFPITVYAREEQVDNIEFAKNSALVSVNYYTRYFNVEYPLPKLDLIAIPDFVSGAMENWGLITFRETRIVAGQNSSSAATKIGVTLTVAHEIAHMWFGDLVTMKWWNDLWLNEGFATFVEYKAAAQVHPDSELDNIFLISELFSVLKLDATLNSHPIVQPVSHPDQITEIFDQISYNKGASVLRMLESTIGEEKFRQGVTAYMNQFKYENAETQDLWNHLDKVADINVTTFMDTFTRQMGFPVISVSVNKNKVTFSQKRFLRDPLATYSETESLFKYRWEVPITFITSESRTIQRAWLKSTQNSTTVELPKEIDWIKVNVRSIGYYIVNYEKSMWDKLNSVIEKNFKTFEPADRAAILNEVFALAEAEVIPYDVALKMTRYLPIENNYIPWSVGCALFLTLNSRLYATEAYIPFLKYINLLIKDLKVMSWEIDDRANYLEKSYQNEILNLGCTVGNITCLNQATQLFKQWLTMPAMKLSPEHDSMILYFGIQQSGANDWKDLWELYLEERNPHDKIKMMTALCATNNTQILSRYLQLGKNESLVRSQDYLSLIAAAANNPTASPIVWDFYRNEWEYLVQKYTLNDRFLGSLIQRIAASFGSETRLVQMKEFFEKYPEAGAGTAARKRALEKVQNNIKWRRKHVSKLAEWFEEHTKPPV